MVKRVLRALRGQPGLNRVATDAAFALLSLFGRKPEIAARHLPRVGLVNRMLPDGQQLRLWSKGDDWVSNQVFWYGALGYEPETSRLFYRMAARARTTIDIGAHVGYYSLLAGHANRHAKVIAFEPLPAVYDRLMRNVRLNGLTNVACVAAAVGRENQTAPFFHVMSLEVPCSSSLSYDVVKHNRDVRSSNVQVVRLDDFLHEHGVANVDIVKLDTEGTEAHVLEGMVRTLERDRPAIICEILPETAGIAERVELLLRPLGYRYYLLTPAGPRATDRIKADLTRRCRNYLLSAEPLRLD